MFNSESINIYKPTIYSIYSIFSRVSGYLLIIGFFYLNTTCFNIFRHHIPMKEDFPFIMYFNMFIIFLFMFLFIFYILILYTFFLIILHIVIGIFKIINNEINNNKITIFQNYILLQFSIFFLFYILYFFLLNNINLEDNIEFFFKEEINDNFSNLKNFYIPYYFCSRHFINFKPLYFINPLDTGYYKMGYLKKIYYKNKIIVKMIEIKFQFLLVTLDTIEDVNYLIIKKNINFLYNKCFFQK